jgi:hypothetical protein
MSNTTVDALEAWLDSHRELPESDPAGSTGFIIEDDNAAVWALRKLRTARTELDRIEALHASEMERLDAWATDASATPAKTVDAMTYLLIEYRRRLQADNPSRPGGYKLPGGTLKRAKATPRLTVSDVDELAEWCAERAPELVTTETKVSASGVKKLIDHDELGRWVDPDTGEVIPGVEGSFAPDVDPDGYRWTVTLDGAE